MRHFLRIAVVGVCLALVSACGSGSFPGAQSSSEPIVGVTLDEFQLQSDTTSVPAGTVTFRIKNTGKEKHEFVILRTDLAVSGISVDPNTNKVTEEGTGVQHVDELDGIDPDHHFDLAVDLKPGRYLLVCNYPGHVHQGMVAFLTAT